jgi:hypothetical protein
MQTARVCSLATVVTNFKQANKKSITFKFVSKFMKSIGNLLAGKTHDMTGWSYCAASHAGHDCVIPASGEFAADPGQGLPSERPTYYPEDRTVRSL